MVILEDWFYRYNSWSFSKHRLWHLCKKCYYYRYIGTFLKANREIENIDVFKLKMLKDLTSKHALQGLLIHDIIESQIRENLNLNELDEEYAKVEFIKKIERYQECARETLTEFFNGYPIDDGFFNYIRTTGIEKLEIFFDRIWPRLKNFEYLKHEEFDNFKINDTPVIVKLDYICKTKKENVLLIDWKTGTEAEGNELDLQLGTYVFYAIWNYDKQPEQIHSELAYLKTGKIQPYIFNYSHLEKIKQKIILDFKLMNKSYEFEDYPANPSPKKCLSCQFGTICPDSQLIKGLSEYVRQN